MHAAQEVAYVAEKHLLAQEKALKQAQAVRSVEWTWKTKAKRDWLFFVSFSESSSRVARATLKLPLCFLPNVTFLLFLSTIPLARPLALSPIAHTFVLSLPRSLALFTGADLAILSAQSRAGTRGGRHATACAGHLSGTVAVAFFCTLTGSNQVRATSSHGQAGRETLFRQKTSM